MVFGVCVFLCFFHESDDLVSLDLSLDLAIYGVFTLLITTATFWRITWKTFKREQPRSRSLKLFLASSAIHLFREVVIIKARRRVCTARDAFIFGSPPLLLRTDAEWNVRCSCHGCVVSDLPRTPSLHIPVYGIQGWFKSHRREGKEAHPHIYK